MSTVEYEYTPSTILSTHPLQQVALHQKRYHPRPIVARPSPQAQHVHKLVGPRRIISYRRIASARNGGGGGVFTRVASLRGVVACVCLEHAPQHLQGKREELTTAAKKS
jgi:hypothetical protein